MKPTKPKIEYEKIRTDDFVTGMIDEIEYDQQHEWKPYQGKQRDPSPACRLKFIIDGYKYPHSTPWMTFSYGDKTNLFSKYIASLVDGAMPDMDFDLDQLKGFKVKMLWKDKGDFQHIETIRPIGKKIKPLTASVNATQDLAEVAETDSEDEEVPF